MPLSVMLAGYTTEFQKGMRPLEPWQGLTERFELVAGRLRSIYLVHWFGTPIPTEGITVRAAIVNSDELRARWLAIGGGRDRRSGPPQANLLEPLMGTSGLLAGALALPFNAMLLSPVIWRTFDSALVKTASVVNWLTFGALFGALLPLGALAVLGLPLVANTAAARSLYDFLGALAQMAGPFREFWQQVSGPRSQVRNALLRVLLDLGDAVAAAAIQLLGVTAELIMRVAPMIGHTIDGLRSTAAAATTMIGMIIEAIVATMTGLQLWWKGPGSPLAVLHAVVGLFETLFLRLGDVLHKVGPELQGILGPNLALMLGALSLWVLAIRPFVLSQTTEHPTVLWLRSLLASLAVFSAWKARVAPPRPPAPPPPPSPPSTFGTLAKQAGLEILRRTGMPPTSPSFTMPRDIAPLTPLPSTTSIGIGALLGSNPFALSTVELGQLHRWRRPPSVFGAEWAALDARRHDPRSVVRTMRAADYLQHLEPVLGRSADAAAEQHLLDFIPALEDVLGRLDDALRPTTRHPTKLLPEPTEIRPVIRRLRVHDDRPADDRARYDAFVTTLRTRLDAAPYLAPAAARRNAGR